MKAGALMAGGAGLSLAAYSLYRMRRHDMQATSLHPTRHARGAEVARMATRVGGAYASNRAQRVFASADRRRELDERLELRTAAEVTQTLGAMKGVLMKVGQLASFLDDGL